MNKEIWKDIYGFEGLYQVSNQGRIKSVARSFVNTIGKINIPERILYQHLAPNGYYMVKLSKNRKKKSFTVHRLVLSSFSINTENKMDVNHIDGIKTNNMLDNLEWSTRSENMNHAYRLGLRVEKTGGDRHNSKAISVHDVVGEKITNYGSIGEFANEAGVSTAAISGYAHNKRLNLFRNKFKITFI